MTPTEIISLAHRMYAEADARLGEQIAQRVDHDKQAEALLALAAVNLSGALELAKVAGFGPEQIAAWLYSTADDQIGAGQP